jgi:hypothetical protein
MKFPFVLALLPLLVIAPVNAYQNPIGCSVQHFQLYWSDKGFGGLMPSLELLPNERVDIMVYLISTGCKGIVGYLTFASDGVHLPIRIIFPIYDSPLYTKEQAILWTPAHNELWNVTGYLHLQNQLLTTTAYINVTGTASS